MGRIRFKVLFLTSFFLISSVFSDIKSNKGEIKFDINYNLDSEMILNESGLGVGTSPSANLHVMGNAVISKQLYVGDGSASSKLNLNGTLEFTVQTVSSNTNLSDQTTILANGSSDNITLTLPYAGNVHGRVYFIKNTQAVNHVIIEANNSTIDEQQSLLVGSRAYVELLSSSNIWHVMSSRGIVRTRGIIDHVSLPTVAYGCRLLSTNYFGPLLKVRRSSDNTTQDIYPDSNGGIDTHSINIWATSSDVLVETWYDQSGNDNHLEQTTEANQPQLILSGETRLSFDGSNDSMHDDFTLNQPFTLIAFNRIGASAQSVNDVFIDGYNSDSIDFRYKTSTLADTYNGGYVTQTYPISANERLLYSFVSNGTSSEVWKNGSSYASGSGGTSAAGGISLGYRRAGNHRFGEFSISDLIIYSSALSDSDRETVQSNINGFWQIY